MPGVGLWRVPFRQGLDAPRGSFSGEPSRCGVLTRSRWRPPTGGRLTTLPDRPSDFSPGLPRPPILRRQGFVPMFQGNLPGVLAAPRTARAISARACRVRRSFVPWASSRCFREPARDARSVTEDHRRALPARPPLSHVSVAGRTSSPRQGEDQYAGGLNAAAPVTLILLQGVEFAGVRAAIRGD